MESSKNPLSEETTSRRRVLQTGAGLVATILSGEVLLQASPIGIWGGRAQASTLDEGLVLQWNTTCVQAIRQMHAGPTLASRMLAIVQTCIYDAWTVYDAVAIGTRLPTKDLRRPPAERTLAHKNQAISYAAYRALVDLFPSQVATFDALMSQLGYDPADQSTDPTQPTGIGNLAAQAVLAFRHQDGSNQLGDLHPGPYSDYTGYQPLNDPDHINDPNHWQPLRVSDGPGSSGFSSSFLPRPGPQAHENRDCHHRGRLCSLGGDAPGRRKKRASARPACARWRSGWQHCERRRLSYRKWPSDGY